MLGVIHLSFFIYHWIAVVNLSKPDEQDGGDLAKTQERLRQLKDAKVLRIYFGCCVILSMMNTALCQVLSDN